MSMETKAKANQAVEEKPYRRGYATPAELRNLIAAAHKTRLWRTGLAAIDDCLTVIGLVLATAWLWTVAPMPLALVATSLACVATGRQIRGLEVLVHEASHFNWSRRHRRANDVLAFVLAAAPTGARIKDYRASHLIHHSQFGTSQDPDLIRYRQLGLEELDRTHWWGFVRSMAIRLPKYQLGWVAAITTNPISLVTLLAWIGLCVVTPAWLLFGAYGAYAAAGAWLISYALVLPVIRFVGESSEHVYYSAQTVYGATVSNIGLLHKALIHPHNDGYHTVHHMWLGIPHHQLKKLHNELVIRDPENYGRTVRYRTHVLQNPMIGM